MRVSLKIFEVLLFLYLVLLSPLYQVEAIEGFYKDVFDDEGTQISGGNLQVNCDYINFTMEHFESQDNTTKQNEIMVQGSNDDNGRLLYPDGEPRHFLPWRIYGPLHRPGNRG